MTINSINIINNLPAHRAKIINLLVYNDKTNVYYDNNQFFWLLMV